MLFFALARGVHETLYILASVINYPFHTVNKRRKLKKPRRYFPWCLNDANYANAFTIGVTGTKLQCPPFYLMSSALVWTFRFPSRNRFENWEEIEKEDVLLQLLLVTDEGKKNERGVCVCADESSRRERRTVPSSHSTVEWEWIFIILTFPSKGKRFALNKYRTYKRNRSPKILR